MPNRPDPRHPISAQGRRKLEDEIARLRRDVRPGVARAITETARAHGMGDISAAKSQLVDFDARIAHLERRLDQSVIVDLPEPENRDRIRFGARVVCRTPNGDEQVLILVGAEEADPGTGRISWNSPVAQALAGARVGSEVDASTPRGEISLEIVGISYP